jgi:hypothetical protein
LRFVTQRNIKLALRASIDNGKLYHWLVSLQPVPVIGIRCTGALGQSRDGVQKVFDMQTDMAFVQALRGARLADNDRKQLEPDYLFLLALREVIQLTTMEKNKLSPDHLFILALRGAVKLTNEDKQRLAPDDLFMLALRGIAHLTPEDRKRLSSDDVMHLQMRGL